MPECSNYYGDLEFGKEELVKAGVDPEVLGISNQARSQSGQRVSNTFTEHVAFKDENDFANFDYDEPILVPAKIPAAVKPVAARPTPVKINSNRAQPPQFRNKPQSATVSRPAPTPAPTKAPTTTTTTTRRTTIPTTTFAPVAAIVTTDTEDFTEAPEIISEQIVDAIDTLDTSVEEIEGDNPNRPQPAVVKAGEDYYYYYYYYDDDETSPDEEA